MDACLIAAKERHRISGTQLCKTEFTRNRDQPTVLRNAKLNIIRRQTFRKIKDLY